MRAFWLVLAAVAVSFADDPPSVSLQLREKADIAKLAAITRIDHSTIFFSGRANSGYVHNGAFHMIALGHGDPGPKARCSGWAVSRDGTRIAYAASASRIGRCRIVVRDLRNGEDKTLAETDGSLSRLFWSLDDAEIACEGHKAYVAISLRDGGQRILWRYPLRINGQEPTRGWEVVSIDWLHQRPELVINADICVPTGKPGGGCNHENQTLLLSSDDSRLLAVAGGAAVSPASNRIAFVTRHAIVEINPDGTERRTITSAPLALFWLPYFKEETFWSSIIWSPQGDRLLFDTVIDEGFNMNVYLVDVKRGRRRRLLKGTSLTILAWRKAIALDSAPQD